GDHWTKLGVDEGLPEGELGRIGVAISPSNPNIVYALIEAKQNAFYRSTDGGYHWEQMANSRIGDRPFYYSECYVDPMNENHIIALQSTVMESIDGGKNWSTLLPYYGVHPDHHAFWWSHRNSKFMIEGNDGGLNISRDGGKNWTFVNNLPVGQFYHVRYDTKTPYNVYGGLQDNGSWVGPSYVWNEGGIRSSDWKEILFGDGFDVAPVPGNSKLAYAMYQNGELNLVDIASGHTVYIKPVADDTTELRFNWNAALATVESEPSRVYFGSQFVHQSDDLGLSWTKISPDLTTNDPNKLKQRTSGGLTPDVTSAENHCTIICISPRQDDTDVIWVGTDDGNIQLTTNGGETWELVSKNIRDLPKGAYVAQVIPDVENPEGAFAVVNNYRQNDWAPYLFHTSNFGKSWQRMVKENQVSGHCLSLAQDEVEPSLLFLGTEHGLYVSLNFGKDWHAWEHDYPRVATQDLQIQPVENDLIIATFGRGIYVLDDIQPLRMLVEDPYLFYQKGIFALPVDEQYMVSFARPNGERFPADAHYEGDNRESGAIFCFLSTIPFVKKDNKKVQITIRNLKQVNQPIISHFETALDSCVCMVYWDFDMTGVRFPSRQLPDDKDEPRGGGAQISPGKYQITFTCETYSDSTEFFVEADPRHAWDMKKHTQYVEAFKRANDIVVRATKGSDILAESLMAVERVKGLLKNAPESTRTKLLAQSDSLIQQIESLQLIYFMPENSKGIEDDSKTLINQLYTMYGYIQPSGNAGNTESIILANQREVDRAIERINVFLEKDWATWRAAVNDAQLEITPPLKKLD
ncbi:MAG: WD40/YVTN/BNR-like repeat-containing protein, partial [Flavobacteriales bacterium]